jgi:hypothetical protein
MEGVMGFKVKTIDIRERDELEPLLISDPTVIEDGLRVITHQHMTDSGPLDVLCVDSEGTLVIIELKNEAHDLHLDQGLRYYDWFRDNMAWVSQAHKEFKIVPEAPPRLILVAPSYTDTVKRISKYILDDVGLQLFEYHALVNEKNEKALICTEIDFGQPPEPPPIATLDKKLEYFQDSKVKELFQNVLSELQAKGIEIKPINGLWISCWFKNKRFMYLSPKRNFFIVKVLKIDDSWTGRMRIFKSEDWQEVIKNNIDKFIEEFKNTNT